MENKYKEILKLYNDFEITEKSQSFLKKFWLNENDVSIKANIFCNSFKNLPDIIFNKNFEIIIQRGGTLFTEDEYISFQKCMKLAGDDFFYIIENEFMRKKTDNDIPILKFKFPANITWGELNNGDETFPDISFELLWVMNKEFFVFGDSGKWAKYAASNYNNTPLDIIGFTAELSSLFHKTFEQSEEEKESILEWIPKEYINK